MTSASRRCENPRRGQSPALDERTSSLSFVVFLSPNRVADAGATDLAGKLRKDCRAPLDGVLFEFNQATLRADSTPALERTKAAVIGIAGANFEVQGHTDNAGGDNYNLKLSQARARSVMALLTAQGVSATRLSSVGYGKTQPIASNETAEGRARNRRVELVCRK
ncbi:MAG TPA: OmpA family protein [Rhodocyclaceae bacterium]|nr:OmpA family protein [Rhodocyclaceae bacterium]